MSPQRAQVRHVPEPNCELNLGGYPRVSGHRPEQEMPRCVRARQHARRNRRAQSKSWLVAGIVPGGDRHPLKKVDADENRLFALMQRWKQEAIKAGREVKRIVVA